MDTARSQTITEAALEVLAEVGYRGFTMVKVADRAGASTATLYRRWNGKQELFLEAITLLARREANHPDPGPFPPAPDTGSVVTDVEILLVRLIALYNSPEGGVFYGLIDEMRRNPQLQKTFREQFINPPRATTKTALRRGIARGELHDIADLDLLVDACYGPVQTRALLSGEPLDEAFAARTARTLLRPYLTTPP